MADSYGRIKLIKGTKLIDGNGGPPLDNGAILIEDGIIKEIGTPETITLAEDVNVEEFTYEGASILPGLVDCHVHLNGFGDGRPGDDLAKEPDELLILQSAKNAKSHLFSGVTTIRDLGSKNQTSLILKKAAEQGIVLAPRLIVCGRPIAIIGGHLSYFGIEATGVVECRAVVRQLIKEGADFIKITTTGGSTKTSYSTHASFTAEEITAICDEAHKFGKHAVAHSIATQGMINALDSGIDSIIHGSFLEPDGTSVFREDIAKRMTNDGVFLNPTLGQGHVRRIMLNDKLEAQGLTPEEQTELDTQESSRALRTNHLHKYQAAGVQLVCGSDSSWQYYPMGAFQHEIDAHVEQAGQSPMDAIVSATRESAKSCWAEDKIGTLDVGKSADILVVNGDPSKNIKNLWNTIDVFLGGELVDRTAPSDTIPASFINDLYNWA